MNNTFRVLATGQKICNDTWKTGLNNNDLIIGPSGAGKTRSYVKPNLMQCEESVIVADTKGCLVQEVGPLMKKRGFQVINIDFTDMLGSYGYNPLDYIRRNKRTGRYSEQDIMTVAACLSPVEGSKEPFWEKSARMYLACMIGYVLECLPPEEHTLEYVQKLYAEMNTDNFDILMEDLGMQNPDSFAYKKYQMFCKAKEAKLTYECIRMFIAEKLDSLTFDGPLQLYKNPKRVKFENLGRKKTAVFLTISDTDRSMDTLASLFYTQAFHALCDSADRDYPSHRLPVPVRLILDDFATNVQIPNFDNLISVIRSREIYVSVILQSLSQLNAIYGAEKAKTIVNNCDNCLYLGGQDVDTARYVSFKANRTMDSVLNMPLGEAYLFTRGTLPRKVRKFEITTHELYTELPEASPERTSASDGHAPGA